MNALRHGSLFSGLGGFDLAATWMGWVNEFHCEIDPFCRRVLKFYWPETESYADIRKFKAAQYRGQIDVLSGGFPCQPFSLAGKRKGTADHRYLWPEMLRVIGEIQPSWVVGENVLGLLNWSRGMVFRQVSVDLEAAGYEVWPYVLPACGVGAPHKRDRIWFVAHSLGGTGKPDSKCEWREPGQGRKPIWCEPHPTGKGGITANSESHIDRRDGRTVGGTPAEERQQEIRPQPSCESQSDDIIRVPSNTDSQQRREGRLYPSRPEKANEHFGEYDAWSPRKAWKDFPTQSPICGGNDGVPRQLDRITLSTWRRKSISACGNAIVPQVALQIFHSIDLFEKASKTFNKPQNA